MKAGSRCFGLLAVIFFLSPCLSYANLLVGGDTIYKVRKGDTVELIGSRLGVSWKRIVRENRLDIQKPLRKGTTLRVNTRKIVPLVLDDGIVINVPDRMLYFLRDGQLEEMFPVALGKVPRKDSADWTTPLGKFMVVGKLKNPSWYVPKSIRAEMEGEGKPVETIVPPGPDNPLGRYALKTSIPGIMIHETTRSWSVYRFRSHGCVRVMPEHMEKFFGKVEVNTPGEVVYMPVKVAISDEGRIFLEVHGDPYRRVKDLRAEARAAIEELGLSDIVDWRMAEKVVKARDGIPKDISATQ